MNTETAIHGIEFAVLGYLLHVYSADINIGQQLHLVLLLETRVVSSL